MAKPIRLQLSRRKGFDLQAASRAANGLEAVNVARPSKWGNPFIVSECRDAFDLPNFGAPVTKTGMGYSGPGIVCGIAIAEDGSPRVVVGHRIESGDGRLMHVYTPGLIQAKKEDAQ